MQCRQAWVLPAAVALATMTAGASNGVPDAWAWPISDDTDSTVGLIAVLPLLYASWRDLSAAWSSGEFYDGLLGIPRWPMRLVFLLGLVAMWVRLAMVAAHDMAELRRTGTVLNRSHAEEEAV